MSDFSSAARQTARPNTIGAPTIIAGSAAMLDVLQIAQRSAAGDAKVLVTGESGVGKDVIARYIHFNSKRARGPFVAVNCAGLTETLLESELFGHVKGSFTGAYRDKRGKLQMADGGTLFLDEVGEMSLRMQALLLRFLETGEIQSVGSHDQVAHANVRVVAATNRNLADRVAAGEFREDLLYRLRVIHIHVPPLRDRRDDIPLLVNHLLKKSERQVTVAEDAMILLQRYRWPGNIRELQNVMEQAMWFADREMIDVGHLPPTVKTAGEALLPMRERRRQTADDLYDALVTGGYSFWEHIHPIFLSRDITRHDIRELVVRGLRTTHGNYRALLRLFGIPTHDYKRFHNFLMAHGCKVDYRSFRQGTPEPARRHKLELPPLRPTAPKVDAADAPAPPVDGIDPDDPLTAV
jgi:transcriptional regulator with PAS, ATPase and Fis domain